MGIFENSVLIQRRVTPARKAATLALAVVSILLLGLAFFWNPVLFGIPAVICLVAWLLVKRSCEVEYEYTYIEGEVDIDIIRAKSRRKSVASVDLEDLIMIAPKDSTELGNYYRDNSAVKKDCSSRDPEAKKYDMVFKNGKGVSIYTFEPDQNILEKVQMKSPRKVIM